MLPDMGRQDSPLEAVESHPPLVRFGDVVLTETVRPLELLVATKTDGGTVSAAESCCTATQAELR
jgi:hypothetical protein